MSGMAIKVTREVVCDLGERHQGEIRQWRITVDHETQVFDLCPGCSKHLVKLWENGHGPHRESPRMKVLTMSEIEARKQKTPPS